MSQLNSSQNKQVLETRYVFILSFFFICRSKLQNNSGGCDFITFYYQCCKQKWRKTTRNHKNWVSSRLIFCGLLFIIIYIFLLVCCWVTECCLNGKTTQIPETNKRKTSKSRFQHMTVLLYVVVVDLEEGRVGKVEPFGW